MKKIFALVLAAMLCLSAGAELDVVCSLFPQYDFTRIIAGEYATVTQLLPPGIDSHEYEPSARDALACDRADLFIYTDDELESWVSALKGGFTHVKTVRCAEGIDLEALNEEWEEISGHDHAEAGEEHHEHAYDAHIWLDPTLAIVMCENIRDALSEADPEHKDVFDANCGKLVSELTRLDGEFGELFEKYPGATLYFGGKFAYSHFLRRYNLSYVSAYTDCSDEGEPGARVIVSIIRRINEDGAKAVFTDELSNGEVAREIARETESEVLLFHTCHNLSKAEGDTSYVELMERNLANIKIALGEN